MMYSVQQTREAVEDVMNMAAYMKKRLHNTKAAFDFLDFYEKEIESLRIFPLAYQCVPFNYYGYEIRLKAIGTYNIFFIVEKSKRRITILRVLNHKQDWFDVLSHENSYNF